MGTFELSVANISIKGNYEAPARVRAVVVLVHGFGEHSGRYRGNIVPLLLELGTAVVSYDNIGHGRSGGKRGHCPGYASLLDVLEGVITKATELFPATPLFLYGHSMGGNLVLNYALKRKHRIKGIIASSPYLRLAFVPPAWKMVLGKVFLKILPAITLPSGLDPNGISRIPEEVAKYKADPLIFDQVSPMYSFPIMEAGEWAIQEAPSLQPDTLLFHGTADPIIDHRATVAFHDRAPNSTLQLFEGGYHELHHDSCRDELFKCIKDWLVGQL